MAKIGVHLVTNIVLTSLPIRVSELLMTTLNPSMKRRKRIADYDPATYELCDWDENETKNLIIRLKKAREEQKATGAFNVLTDAPADLEPSATHS